MNSTAIKPHPGPITPTDSPHLGLSTATDIVAKKEETQSDFYANIPWDVILEDVKRAATLDSVPPPNSSALVFPTPPPTPAVKRRVRPSQKGLRKPRSPDHIPRPPNAFLLYRAHLKSKKMEDINQQYVSLVAGTCWKDMNDEEKAPWYNLAKQKAAEHREMYPDYKYTPSKPKAKRKHDAKRLPASQEIIQDLQKKYVTGTGGSVIELPLGMTCSSGETSSSEMPLPEPLQGTWRAPSGIDTCPVVPVPGFDFQDVHVAGDYDFLNHKLSPLEHLPVTHNWDFQPIVPHESGSSDMFDQNYEDFSSFFDTNDGSYPTWAMQNTATDYDPY